MLGEWNDLMGNLSRLGGVQIALRFKPDTRGQLGHTELKVSEAELPSRHVG